MAHVRGELDLVSRRAVRVLLGANITGVAIVAGRLVTGVVEPVFPLVGLLPVASLSYALIGTALAGIPVSTTHTITGAIMGVGATRRLSAVRWGVAEQIVWAWILTIPASALVAATSYKALLFLPH